MTASLARAAVVVVVATLALIATVQVAPERRAVAVSVYLLLLGAAALRLLVRLVWLAHPPPGPSELDAALRERPAPPMRPAELEALSRTLVLASASATYAHTRLRPELRAIAAELLAWHRGIDLAAQPEAARAALGEATWELLRPDRAEPRDHEAPGLPAPLLKRIVAELEEVVRQ
ncbi:MAG TPA: hypothetical protein VFA46_09870 [Actinomycetes bacterium]|nr:hypothetical protein [Actinomycetes bacterium]